MILVNEYEAYVIFSSIRLFFSGQLEKPSLLHDVFTPQKFRKEKKVDMFVRLAREYQTARDVALTSAINLFYNPKLYVQDLVVQDSRENFYKFKGWLSAPAMITKEEFYNLKRENENFLLTSEGMTAMMAGKLSPASYILLNRASVVKQDDHNVYMQNIIQTRLDRFAPYVVVRMNELDSVKRTFLTPDF